MQISGHERFVFLCLFCCDKTGQWQEVKQQMRAIKQEIIKLCFLHPTNVHVVKSQSIVLYNEKFQRNSVKRRCSSSLILRKSRKQKICTQHTFLIFYDYTIVAVKLFRRWLRWAWGGSRQVSISVVEQTLAITAIVMNNACNFMWTLRNCMSHQPLDRSVKLQWMKCVHKWGNIIGLEQTGNLKRKVLFILKLQILKFDTDLPQFF